MFSRISLALSVSIALILALATSGAAAPPGVVGNDYKEIMPLQQVRPGMKGYGLTVFKGTEVERFNVEVIGILRKVNNGKDWIFVRMDGGPITTQGANIIQGMSGSPVYINGKIIGAVAYGPGSFAKEPLAMLTPIEDMLDALDPKLPAAPSGLSAPSASLSSPITVNGETFTKIEIRSPGDLRAAEKGSFVATPLMTPLMVSGMSARGIAKLADILQPFAISPMAGPGSKSDVAAPLDIKPGSALGVSLVTGDIDMTGIGTVTYVRDKQMIAFGHPMLGIGPINAPMTTAYVHGVFPSYMISSKIASPVKTVGCITQDRPWSIGGEIGKTPEMIPVTIDINDKSVGRKRTYNVRIINHPLLATQLLLVVSSEALTEIHGIPVDSIAKMKYTVDVENVGEVSRENVFFDETNIETAALEDLQRLLITLSNNKFQRLDVKSVRLSITIEPSHRTATVERIFLEKSKFEPGETFDVGVMLRPYKSDLIEKTVQVTIPESASDGSYTLVVSGGPAGASSTITLASGMRLMPTMASPSAYAENVRQMIDKLLEQEKNNELVAKLQMPSSAVNVGGHKLSNLPDALVGVVRSPRSSAVKVEREELKTIVATDYVLSGQQAIAVKVERRKLGEKKTPAAPQPPMSPQSESAPDGASEMGEDEMTDGSMDFPFSTPVGLAAATDNQLETQPKATEPQKSSSNDSEPTKPSDEKKPAEQSAKAAPQADKTVVRQPTVWRTASYKDFTMGTANGVAASTHDDLRLEPALTKLADIPADYVWATVFDESGGAFAATGNKGIIYHVAADGSISPFFDTGELMVLSLVRSSDGALFAGTCPNGKIFAIDATGKGEVIFSAPEKYITALAVNRKGELYAGTGDAGKIYGITADGNSSVVANLKAASTLCLALDASDNLFAGTAKKGVIFKIADGKVSAIYDAGDESISDLAIDSKGTIYACTGTGKGNVYKISASDAPKTIFDKAPRALSLSIDASDNLYVASDEQIYKITPDEAIMSIDTHRSGAQFISLAATPSGEVFAGTANRASIYRSDNAWRGAYESLVKDAGPETKWGTISWFADAPQGTSVSLQTRTGNSSEPDNTWSGWSGIYQTSSGQQIVSPAGRYIQYKATLTGQNGNPPALKQVAVSYLPQNRAPKITVTEPQLGTVLSRKQSIKWKGTDPDKDTLIYDLYYSGDAGKTWQALGSDLRQTNNREEDETPNEASDAESNEDEMIEEPSVMSLPDADELMAQLESELSRHSDIPQEIKDKMLETAPAAIAKGLEAAASLTSVEPDTSSPAGNATNSTKQTSYTWDTTAVPDGSYMIRIVASDRVSNADDSLTDEKTIGPFIVSNKPPTLYVFQRDLRISDDKAASIDGYVFSDMVPIAGVQYKVGNGDWMAAAAKDGVFDSNSEGFRVTTQTLPKGKRIIQIKTIDIAGNSASKEIIADVQ